MNRRQIVQPLLLVLVFFGPIALAALAYYGGWAWAPSAPHGELLEPPLALPQTALGAAAPAREPRRWSFIYARTSPCRRACLGQLVRMHQVHRALAEDGVHVQRVLWLAGPAPPLPPEAGWITSRLDGPFGRAIIALLGAQTVRDGRIYVADPHGTLVVSYPPDAAQKGMLEDLKRLLKLSTVG